MKGLNEIIMKICGIVAEFDPFHNGHKYLIDSSRAEIGGDTAIVAVMSGNFVQRGAPACSDKFTRAKAALHGGVDLVLELPTFAALSTAQRFTAMGVKTLIDTGVTEFIAFGSECGDVALLQKCAAAVNDDAVNADIAKRLSHGVTYAAARAAAVSALFGDEIAAPLYTPNDILALGYIDAINALGSNITPIAVKREGAAHNGEMPNGDIASASHIRELIYSGEPFDKYVPKSTAALINSQIAKGTAPANVYKHDIAVISRLRQYSAEDFARLCDVSEGLHNRIYSAVQSACSLNELYDSIKTKRYTHARIRRLIMSAALGIFCEQQPQYLRVLGFTDKGADVLGKIKQKGAIPIVCSYADAKKLGENAAAQFDMCAKYTDFYNLLNPRVQPCGDEYRQAVVKI